MEKKLTPADFYAYKAAKASMKAEALKAVLTVLAAVRKNYAAMGTVDLKKAA